MTLANKPTLLCATLALLCLCACSDKNAAPETPQAAAAAHPGSISYPVNAPQLSMIKVGPLKLQALPAADSMNGRLSYDENLTARVSSPVLGRLLSAPVEIGDSVKKDTTLALLDSPDLAAADADWAKAKADETRKQLTLTRSQQLFEHEIIARKELEGAQADYQQAAAETRRAALRMRNLKAVGNENGSFALKAPIAGMIADKQVNPGMEVRPDAAAPLFVISDLSHLWVVIDVPEAYLGQVQIGQKLALEFDAYPNQLFSAEVARVGLALDPSTRRIQVRGVLSNRDMKLRPEMFATVSFLAAGDKQGYRIPNTALIVEGLYSYLFVEKRAGEFEKQKVHIQSKGRDASFAAAEQNPALNEHVKIVSEGALLLNAEVATHAQ